MSSRHSVLFVRLFSVVVLMILVTALITTIIYNFVARSLFTRMKEEELLPKARSIGRMIEQFQSNSLDFTGLLGSFTMDQASDNLLGAYMVVVNQDGEETFASSWLDPVKDSMIEAARMVLTKGELRTADIPQLKHTSMVGVGVPLGKHGHVRGATLMVVPAIEASLAMGSLNGALMLSLMLSLPLTAIIVFYVIGRVVNPLRQMRNVASKMAAGDFTQRADASQRGEVGELGGALNFLSQELSLTISTLVLERNRLEQTINGLSEGIVSVDNLLRVTHTNPAIGRMGITPDEGILADFRGAIQTGEHVSRPLNLPGRVIRMSIAPILNEAGEIAGAVGLFTDITESERLERTRRDYVANVSHEMRTPLTAMRALVEPLSEGMVQKEETKQRYYSIMLRETMRLSRLIDDLMELSRLQSGSLLLSAEKVRLTPIFEELAEKYVPIAGERGLRFTLDESLSGCPDVLSNPDRVEQVLVILIDNAIKYTPEGGVTLSAAWDDERVLLSVGDTGIGIDPQDQPYVFDRFYKVDKAHSGMGSGLGLSIASELLKLMGEEIRLTSQPNEGSTFSFTLKRA